MNGTLRPIDEGHIKVEIGMSTKEEFDINTWIIKWERHQDPVYVEFFKIQRGMTSDSTSYWLWYPETQVTEDKIFYMIPARETENINLEG
jgi:hypothetical protein